MRPIDADALMNVIDEKFQEHYGNTVYQFIHDFFRFVIRQIRKAPTIDAVPVVRCKDCEHWHEETGYCDNHSYFIGIDGMSCSPAESPSWTTWDEDDFCSDGERKDGDG